MIRLLANNVNGISTFRTLANVRFLSQTTRMLNKPSDSTPAKSETPAQAAPTEAGPAQAWQKKSATSQLSAFDKKVLVWSGKYKNTDEVPPTVALVGF